MNYVKALAMCGATLVAAVAIGTVASSVQAASPRGLVVVANPEDYVMRHISYADLNLAVAPGEATLNRRVGYAVIELCNDAEGGSSTRFQDQECRSGAWSGARPQVALAIQRAHEIAMTGTSTIAAAVITVSLPH